MAGRTRRRRGTSAVADAKNALRGAIDNKKADVLDVLSTSLDRIALSDISIFADWVERFPAKRVQIFPPQKVTLYKDLRLQSFAVVRDLSKAIRWTTEFLINHRPLVQGFIDELSDYENALLSGNHEQAVASLDRIESKFGLSLWLIEARIAVLQRFHGLEAQKKYTQYVCDQVPGSIPGFIAYYVSQRNEESTSYDRFCTRMRTEICRQPVPRDIQLYLENRLIGKHLPLAAVQGACACLCISSAFTIIDAYEALVDTLQGVMHFPALQDSLGLAAATIRRLELSDWRLTKLHAVLTGTFGELPYSANSPADAFVRGEYKTAANLAITRAVACPTDLDALAVAALGSAFGDQEANGSVLSAVQREILNHLDTLLAKREPAAKAVSEISKIVQNLRSIRVVGALHGYLDLEWFDGTRGTMLKADSLFYCSPFWNPRHWFVLAPESATALLAHCQQHDYDLVTGVAVDQCDRRPIHATIPTDVQQDLSYSAALYHQDMSVALDCAKALANSDHPHWRRVAANSEIKCLVLSNHFQSAVKRAVAFCCQEDDFRFVLPLRGLLTGVRWQDVAHLRDSIALPIIFDLHWRTIDEVEHETNRRNAYAEFLAAHCCKRPSDLRPQAESFERRELIYFLRYVCTQEVMDVAFDAFANSREIQEERIEICTWLSVLDEINAEIYSEETQSIQHFLTVQDGLRDVDSSRVHVNVDAVARWAKKELQETFTRYKDLLRAGIGFGSPEDFERIVKAVVKGDSTTVNQFLEYPDAGGGDRLLADLFEAIAKEFLTNPDYGLDAYLSMRIRHGSLAGRMRGPLEERNLIVTKSGPLPRYQDNTTLADKIALHSDEGRNCLFSAFRVFSETYDEIIEDLTKNRLQIRRPEKPQGMFHFDLGANRLMTIMARTQIQETTSFDDCLTYIFTVLETFLEQALLQVRIYIGSTVKHQVEEAFEKLRSSLEEGALHSQYGQLNSVIAGVIPEVQAALAQIEEWFAPARKRQHPVGLTSAQMVDIGIETTKLAHKGFNPVIRRDIEHFLAPMAALAEFTDILYTILSNVYFHSGNKISPWLNLRVWRIPVEKSEMTILRAESEVTLGAFDEACAAKLESIRRQLISGEYRQQMNIEGGTGFKKLKRALSGDPRQTLEFGFTSDGAFAVQVGIILPPFVLSDVDDSVEIGFQETA